MDQYARGKMVIHSSHLIDNCLFIIHSMLYSLSSHLLHFFVATLFSFEKFVGTFLQAFLILYFVHWHWNRFDISLDAVIKYFACGFIITTSTAVCFELLESTVLNLAFKIITTFIIIDEEQNDDGYGGSMNLFEGGYGFNVFEGGHGLYSAVDDRKKAFQRQHPFLAIVFLFCSAYIIAALVEESCKYFGFKMVEHPDLVPDADLENAVAYGVFDDDEDDEDRFECGGGLECGDDLDDLDGGDFRDLDAARQAVSSRFIDGSTDGDYETKEQRLTRRDRAQLYECPPKSLCSTGAAITVAMVSVALGFACCENLIYIFFYNRGPLDSEIAVLISRSLFPVHPLCAGKFCIHKHEYILTTKFVDTLCISCTCTFYTENHLQFICLYLPL